MNHFLFLFQTKDEPSPESTTNVGSPRTVVHSTTPPLTKKFTNNIVSFKVESPNPLGSSENKTTRLITLIPAGSAPNVDRPATPNILKRKPTTTVSLAPKRPMISTTTFAVTTLPSSTSSERPSPPSISADSAGNGYPPQTQFPDIDHSPLSLLAEEASRRTPSLNLSPSTTLDVPLDPKFIGGPIIAGSKYYQCSRLNVESKYYFNCVVKKFVKSTFILMLKNFI